MQILIYLKYTVDVNDPYKGMELVSAYSNPNKNNPYYEIYKKFVKDLIISKRIETLYSSEDNEVDIFKEIFIENCRKTKEINDFLLKHDIKKCIK